MKIHDLSYLETISQVSSVKGGKQSSTVNIYQNAYASAGNSNGIATDNTATAINIVIVYVTNTKLKARDKIDNSFVQKRCQ